MTSVRTMQPKAAALSVAMALAVGLIAFDQMCSTVQAGEKATAIPPPARDRIAGAAGLETAVLAGGCFWGVQVVFQHVEGVESAVSGYAGGSVVDPSYKQVTSGTSGHAEAVRITYDPEKVSYGKLLQIFFSVAHDPTQLNRQGPDVGTHYRSAVFVADPEQEAVVAAYIAQLDDTGAYSGPIVTEVSNLETFYPAEDYHQDYATLHPNQPYVMWNDAPKVENLRTMFPDVWRDEPRLVRPGQTG